MDGFLSSLLAALPLIEKVKSNIINPVIGIITALAVIFFLFGMLEAVGSADNDKARETGRKHMLWGVIGLFIIVAAIGIVNLISSTVRGLG